MSGDQAELMAEAGCGGRSQEVKKEAEKQRWEAQWQEFLEMLEPSSRIGNKPVISEAAPWNDAKAFLASFEEVANACHWPKEEWVTRLLPALNGIAEEAFQSLEAGDREDYGKVKAAILRGDALRMEVRRQHFRDFSCQEVEDPRRLHSQVRELCHRWLRPERHSKEQILELLILEQFLASLPPDLQGWIRAGGPNTCSQAVALAEDFLVSQERAERAKLQGLMVAKEACPSSLKSHQDLTQPSSQTVFWQVLQEEGETINSLDDTMGRQVKMEDPQWERNEPMDVPRTAAPASEVNLLKRTEIDDTMGRQVKMEDPQWERNEPMDVPRTAAPASQVNQLKRTEIDDTMGRQVKMENPQWDRNEPMDVPKTAAPASEVNLLKRTEIDDTMGRQVKMENPQWERNEPMDVPKTAAPANEVNLLKRTEIGEEECGMKEDQSAERDKEPNEFRDHLKAIVCQPFEMSTREETPTTLKCGRRYPCKSEPDRILTRKKHNECVTSEEAFQENVYSDKQQRVVTGEIKPEFLENVEGDHLDMYRYDRAEEDPKDSASGESYGIQSEGRLFECSQCGKGFLQRRNLMIHQKSHTGEKLYKCYQCGKSFSQRRNLNTHQRIHTGAKPYKCYQCGKCFSLEKYLKAHQGIHTGAETKPYKCSQCRKSFYQEKALLVHQRIHTGEKPYECSQCGKCFSQRRNLNTHQRIHTGAKPYKCFQCGKCFSLGRYLKVHQRIHPGGETKSYKCSQCGKSFNQKKWLLVHQRIHTGEKPYKCSQCGKCFSQQGNLRSHCRIHTGEKPHKCLECGKSFKRSNQLKIHQIIHTGEKPYECSQCGKCFNQQGNLMNHWRIHTGEKPHKCLECGKSFKQINQLKTHQIIHTGERP
uniref:Uncharacterized protein isoform X1 n=1 Tax=Pogona vitticeps TaxID=103695 RepID=A0ABM5FGN0_9SAUR